MFPILSAIIGLAGLLSFLTGLSVGLLEVWDLAPTLVIVLVGMIFMSLSAVIWLRLLPSRIVYALQLNKSTTRNRQKPLGIIGVLDVNNIQNKSQGANQTISIKINPEATESLLKSIRGATYLIQVILLYLTILISLGDPV